MKTGKWITRIYDDECKYARNVYITNTEPLHAELDAWVYDAKERYTIGSFTVEHDANNQWVTI